MALRLRLIWLGVTWRARHAWYRVHAPQRLHPETLYGYDGEPPHFVRADLAETKVQAAAFLAADAGLTIESYSVGMDPVSEIALVWMLPHKKNNEPCEDDESDYEEEGWYDVVAEGTCGATRYWRWSW